MNLNGSVTEEKPYIMMVLVSFFSELDWVPYVVSIVETASNKFVALISSMKFLSPKVERFLYKSTIQPGMEYCSHVPRSGYVGLMVIHLLPLLNPWFIDRM